MKDRARTPGQHTPTPGKHISELPDIQQTASYAHGNDGSIEPHGLCECARSVFDRLALWDAWQCAKCGRPPNPIAEYALRIELAAIRGNAASYRTGLRDGAR